MKVYSKRSLRSFQPKECHSVSERTLGSARGWFAESTCSSAFKTCTSWAGQRPIIPYVRPAMWYLLFSTCLSKRNSMSTPHFLARALCRDTAILRRNHMLKFNSFLSRWLTLDIVAVAARVIQECTRNLFHRREARAELDWRRTRR